jgi:hypothetical protein
MAAHGSSNDSASPALSRSPVREARGTGEARWYGRTRVKFFCHDRRAPEDRNERIPMPASHRRKPRKPASHGADRHQRRTPHADAASIAVIQSAHSNKVHALGPGAPVPGPMRRKDAAGRIALPDHCAARAGLLRWMRR